MKKLAILLSLLLIASINTSTSHAADDFEIDPVTIMLKTQPATGARGMIFIENVSAGTSVGWVRYSHIPTFNSDGSIDPNKYWDWKLCSSWTDKNCEQKQGFTTEGKVILGPCKNSQELGCLEEFAIKGVDGSPTKVTYVGLSYSGTTDIPEVASLGIPRSSSPAIYKDESGNLYVVRAGVWISRTGPGNNSYKLDVDVTPVAKTSRPEFSAPVAQMSIDPRTNKGNVYVIPSPSECVTTDVGICYKALKMSNQQIFTVSVRVPHGISGWLRGRVTHPTFDAKSLNENSQLITVSAEPAQVPIIGGWVNYKDLPHNFIESVWPSGGYDPNPSASYFLIGSPSQGDQGTREYLAWTPYLGDKSLVTINSWSFGTNISNTGSGCLAQPGKITGFVSSNAAVYSSNPPTWNSSTSTLSYKVGAPHFDENGRENSGKYTLAMPLKTIECLYGETSMPASATVSISYGSEVVSVATVTLSSQSGWVYFSANGFHYSNPTIQVKFAKPASKAVPSQQALKTQWCAKGYAKKKVVALNPVCPKGYKKIPAPL